MQEPISSIKREDGLAMSILYKRLDTCMTNMVDSLPRSSQKEGGIEWAQKFLQYSKMALDTIPVTKCDKTLFSIADENWKKLYEMLRNKHHAPEKERFITQNELLLLHMIDADIVKCIDSAGLGWGDFLGLNTKGSVIRQYMERGRNG